MFPNDAITIRTDNNSANNNVNYNVLPTGTYTILQLDFNSASSESSSVSCGSNIIARHYATFNTNQTINWLCENTISANLDNKTSINLTYVPYNLRLVPTSSGNFSIDNGATFTAGDMFIGFLLLLGIVIAIITLALKSIFGVKIHREFLGVNSTEGKENYKI